MIYLDSCVLIYLVEPESPAHDVVQTTLARSADGVLAISPLVVLECLVGPLRSGDPVMQDAYERAFGALRLLPLSLAVGRRASGLRAEHRLKTPDAIHLAAALEGGCDELWTNDDRLSRAAGDFARVMGR